MTHFATTFTLPLDSFDIRVKGLGKLTYPLNQATIATLLSLSQPAKYGHYDKAILDKNVRSNQEVSTEAVVVRTPKKDTGQAIAQKIIEGLGHLCELDLSFHNLLVYQEEGHFMAHQDTEKKTDGMVATLSVVLPSPHFGGELEVYH